jgi:hypothetical protein
MNCRLPLAKANNENSVLSQYTGPRHVTILIGRSERDGNPAVEVNNSRALGHAEERSKVMKYLTSWKERAMASLRGDGIFNLIESEVHQGIKTVRTILSDRSYKLDTIQNGSRKIKEAAVSLIR